MKVKIYAVSTCPAMETLVIKLNKWRARITRLSCREWLCEQAWALVNRRLNNLARVVPAVPPVEKLQHQFYFPKSKIEGGGIKKLDIYSTLLPLFFNLVHRIVPSSDFRHSRNIDVLLQHILKSQIGDAVTNLLIAPFWLLPTTERHYSLRSISIQRYYTMCSRWSLVFT